jgi:hypothetical protein
MSEFSGKTTYLAGIIRPDGKAVMANPLDRMSWQKDESLDIAGYSSDGSDGDYGLSCAKRGASVLTEDLISRGVAADAAEHKAALFVITTTVQAEEPPA